MLGKREQRVVREDDDDDVLELARRRRSVHSWVNGRLRR